MIYVKQSFSSLNQAYNSSLSTQEQNMTKLQSFKSLGPTSWCHLLHIVTSPKQYVTLWPHATQRPNVTYYRLMLRREKTLVETKTLFLVKMNYLIPISEFPTKPITLCIKYQTQLDQNIPKQVIQSFLIKTSSIWTQPNTKHSN